MEWLASRPARWPVWILLLSLLGTSRAFAGDDELARKVAGSDLDALLHMKVSISARVPEEVLKSSAAVYVITAEDIRRSGLTLVPEILRLAPGVHVARIDANKWAISIRDWTDRFSTKLLVLMDGRVIYTPLFSGVYWDVQDVMIEDIERIEVVRGPGAALWGSNAVNGVINIVTRNAADTEGGLAVAAVGDQDLRAQGALRYGWTMGDRAHVRLSSRYVRQDAGRVPDAGQSSNRGALPPGTQAQDGWELLHGDARLDWQTGGGDRLTMIANGHHGEFGQTRLLSGGTVADQDTVEAGGGFGVVEWSRTHADGRTLQFSLHYTETVREDAALYERRRTGDVDYLQRTNHSNHELTWGALYRRTSDDTHGKTSVVFEPAARMLTKTEAFVQDRIGFAGEKGEVSLGAKLENFTISGTHVQPSLRARWTPDPRHSYWSAVSFAVRTPSRAESDLQLVAAPGVTIPLGNPDLAAEMLTAYEAGVRIALHPALVADAAGFFNVYEDQINGAGNDGAARTAGGELVLLATPLPAWRLDGNYAYCEFVRLSPANFRHQPARHMASARSRLDLPGDLEFDVQFFYVDHVSTNVPAYRRLDVRGAWHPVEPLTFSAGIQNATADAHVEMTEAQRLNTGVERSLWGRVEVRF